MEEKQDPIVNVGIKQTQKEKVSELISKNYAYKSINEFVQNATSKLLDAETKKTATNSSSMESVLGELQEFNITLLKEDFLDLNRLNDHVIAFIKRIKNCIEPYRSYDEPLTKLLLFRNLKDILNQYFSYLENRNEPENLGISKYKLAELKSLIEKFINLSTQEVKG